MLAPKKSLFLILTALMALTSACASSQLRATGVEAKPTDPQPQQDSRPAAAVVKAKRANLREKPFQSATVVSTVNKGDLLSLSIAVPVGPWYHIRDSKTGAEGWIHGNTIALLQTVDTSTATSDHVPRTTSTSAQRSRRISPTVSDNSSSVSSSPRGASGRSYVNVDGVRVPSPVFSDTRPAGASARCRDGSYSFSQNRRGTCSHHGGVAEWY